MPAFGVKQVFNPWLKAIANQTVDESSGVGLLNNIFRTHFAAILGLRLWRAT